MSMEAQWPARPVGRRERRKLEVHARILEANLELFDARGAEATKVQDICERADVAHKTFFNHFASKRHLLREVARASTRAMCATDTIRKP